MNFKELLRYIELAKLTEKELRAFSVGAKEEYEKEVGKTRMLLTILISSNVSWAFYVFMPW
jgi:hypothetical protein